MRRTLIILCVLALTVLLLGVVFVPAYTLRGGILGAPMQGGGYELRGGALP